jgi:23S rRNA (uridine2552-2'-O)-methyltransferase
MRPALGNPPVASYERRDHFHRRAKSEGFRSRAAYKLAEIQRTQLLLHPGDRVVDLGCWPGGWLQVASAAVGPTGRVVGVDLTVIDPPLENENVIALCGDIAEAPVVKAILAALGWPADVLLSDAAPKLTGIRAVDRAREEALLESVEARIPELLRPGGALLLKILEGPEAQAIDRRLRARFEQAKTAKAAASRKGSTERYLLARGYRGSGS